MSESLHHPQPDLSYLPADQTEPVLEQTLGLALRQAAMRFGSRTALVEGVIHTERRRWSFIDVLAESEKVARALLGRFEPGEHVAIWAANCPEWVFVEFGAALAGITLVTVNPAYLANELAYVLKQSQSRGILLQSEYRGRNHLSVIDQVRSDVPALRETIPLSLWSDFVHSGSPTQSLPQISPKDIAQIQYTSGTTGFPKGALLTHRGMANNGRFFAKTVGATEQDVWINPMPMFHTAGCGLVTIGALQTGGTHVLPAGFDPATMLTLFEQEQGTLMLSVPTMLIRLLDQAASTQRTMPSFRLSMLGGAPVSPELVRRAAAQLGVKVAIGFGQTESSPYLTHTLPEDPHPDWVNTVGRPLPQTEIKVIHPATGDTIPIGILGEICARGYSVMNGYFDNPRATQDALDSDGWLHTGDLGSIDERGYVRVQGRLKDMIIRGGENIYPKEIEDRLFTHPAVASVAVVGIPDPEWGETVAACIQLRPEHAATDSELAAYCRQRLASYKIPRHFFFVSQMPQTASGKVQKFVLREQIVAELSQRRPQ